MTGCTTAYCHGHRVERHGHRGVRWWTVDEGDQRFESMQDAVCYLRSLDSAAAGVGPATHER